MDPASLPLAARDAESLQDASSAVPALDACGEDLRLKCGRESEEKGGLRAKESEALVDEGGSWMTTFGLKSNGASIAKSCTSNDKQ